MLDVRKLRMLAELDRLGTVAAVAIALRQTAPGISMQLAALEREVGLKLTERRGRGVALTPAGRLLAHHGRDIVGMLSLAEAEVAALQSGSTGHYRLAAFPSIARTVVADAWKRLMGAPEFGLSIELVELEPQDSLPALANGDVEVALTHSYSNMAGRDDDRFVSTPIGTERVFLASLDAGEEVELERYATAAWLVPDRRWACWEMVQRATGLAGFTPRVVAEATDFSVLLALVAAGAGVALIPELAIATLPDGVTLRPLVRPVFRHDFVVTRQATNVDSGARALVALLADSAQARIATRV